MSNPQATHIAKKNSLEMPVPQDSKDEFKYLNVMAKTTNPNTPLMLFIQPPALGNDVKALGNKANKKNGAASTVENPSILTIG